jgi:hypothetical protein
MTGDRETTDQAEHRYTSELCAFIASCEQADPQCHRCARAAGARGALAPRPRPRVTAAARHRIKAEYLPDYYSALDNHNNEQSPARLVVL